MALALTIEIKDYATPEVQRVIGGLDPRKISPVLARAATNRIKEHLYNLDSTRPNKLGGSRTHFYAQAARGTQFQPTPDGFVVGINQVGIRLRFFGGTVTPGKNPSRYSGKPTKYLTIPVAAEAYGKRAGEFHDLRFAMVPFVGPALVKAQATLLAKSKKKANKGQLVAAGSQGGEVMFRLVKSARIPADPTILPTPAVLDYTVQKAGNDYIALLASRRGGSAPDPGGDS